MGLIALCGNSPRKNTNTFFLERFVRYCKTQTMEDKAATIGQLPSSLVGEDDPEAGIETTDIEKIERVYR